MTEKQFVIDPNQYKTDKRLASYLLIFWVMWSPVTAFITFEAINKPDVFTCVWLMAGFIGTLVVPYIFIMSRCKQVVEVFDDGLILSGMRLLPICKVVIKRSDLLAVVLDTHTVSEEEQRNPFYMLQFIYGDCERSRRVYFAYLIHPQDKVVILDQLCEYLREHKFSFSKENNMPKL